MPRLGTPKYLKDKHTRAAKLLQRAIDNRRIATTPLERTIASNQYMRVLAILARINNLIQIDKDERTAAHADKQATKRVPATHPITKRKVHVSIEQARQWKLEAALD